MKISTRWLIIIFSALTLFSVQASAVETSKRSAATIVADAAITTYVKAKLALDKNFSRYDIKVSTNDHVVSLTGVVNAPVEIDSIATLVKDTAGVKEVNVSQLTVRNDEQSLADALITTKILINLAKAKWIDKRDLRLTTLHVYTKNGIVYLTGTAENSTQIENATQAADDIKGVLRITSLMKIDNTVDSKK